MFFPNFAVVTSNASQEMKNKHLIFSVLACLGLTMAGCHKAGMPARQLAGTMDSAVPADTMPADVRQAMDQALRYHCYDILSDTANGISVTAIGEVDQTPTAGYGIVVTKGATSTTFPDIRHTREPQASYHAATDCLWLTSAATEGTGVRVEWLYQIAFGSNDSAYVKATVNPYDVQQALLQRLGYAMEGDTITIYDGDKLLTKAACSASDMGGYDDEQPLWIGEQLYYDVSSSDAPRVIFTPGVKFTTGLVLTYDDMPELSAPVTIAGDGRLHIHDISIRQAP